MEQQREADHVNDSSTVDRLATRAHDAVDTVHDQAQRMAHDAEATLDGASATLSEGLSTAAGRLRAGASGDGMIGSAAGSVADRLEAAASFLRDHNLRSIVSDARGLVRRRPIQASILGLGIGYLLGRGLSSRRRG
jgi:ElaB/YqjD/DUF883 family membrane-anchored ribosome-binding protein